MTPYHYFAQNFLMAFLAAVAAGIVIFCFGNARQWPMVRWIVVVVLVAVAGFTISWSVTRKAAEPLVIAGTVVDENGHPVGQAVVTLVADEALRAVSEDNGNFTLDLSGKVKGEERIRVHVTKQGYRPYDGSTQVPTAELVVQLHHL